MSRFWAWCDERAPGGWLLMIAITVVLFAVMLVYLEARVAETIRACGGL